jgi:hypothetical protein
MIWAWNALFRITTRQLRERHVVLVPDREIQGVRRMNDEPEESEQRRRDMIQIVWFLMPVAVFFVLLLLFEWFWLYGR